MAFLKLRGLDKGNLEGSSPPMSPHGLFRGNMCSLAPWAADSLLKPLSLSQWMEEKFYHL